jgi:hypothetical protein
MLCLLLLLSTLVVINGVPTMEFIGVGDLSALSAEWLTVQTGFGVDGPTDAFEEVLNQSLEAATKLGMKRRNAREKFNVTQNHHDLFDMHHYGERSSTLQSHVVFEGPGIGLPGFSMVSA